MLQTVKKWDWYKEWAKQITSLSDETNAETVVALKSCGSQTSSKGGRQSQWRTLGSDGSYSPLASSAWPHGTGTALLRASVARWERRWGANNIPTFPKRIGDRIFMWNILTVKHWKQIQRLKNLFMPNQMCLPTICCPKAPVGWSYANIFWAGLCLSVP